MNPEGIGHPETSAQTQVPAAPVGEASPAPLSLVLVLWIGTFSVITWGLAVLFRQRHAPDPPDSD